LLDELAQLRPEENALLVLLRTRSNGGVSVTNITNVTLA